MEHLTEVQAEVIQAVAKHCGVCAALSVSAAILVAGHHWDDDNTREYGEVARDFLIAPERCVEDLPEE